MRRGTSRTSSSARQSRRTSAEPSLPYEDWLIEQLKDPIEAAAYLEAAIEQGHQAALMLALRHVAMAQGGIAAVARRAKITREAAYRMLSTSGNPELRSLSAILAAAGLKLSVKPIAGRSGVAQKAARYRVSKRAPDAPDAPSQVSGVGVDASRAALARVCRKYGVRKLSLFGSAARKEMKSTSDVDLLVEFAPESRASLFDFPAMQRDFSELFGHRRVDLVPPEVLKNPYRRKAILPDLRVIYEAR